MGMSNVSEFDHKIYDPDLHEQAEGPSIPVISRMLEGQGKIVLPNNAKNSHSHDEMVRFCRAIAERWAS